jgi:hypothetical protein
MRGREDRASNRPPIKRQECKPRGANPVEFFGPTGYLGGGQLSNSMVGKPLGTDAGTSLQRFCFRALGSRSPLPTKATRFSKSSRDRSGGFDKRGSIRASTGSIGPRRYLRSLATPAAAGSYLRANGGDGHALDRLMEIVYPELRRVACRSCYMSRATPWLSPQARQTQARAGRVWITHPYEKKL